MIVLSIIRGHIARNEIFKEDMLSFLKIFLIRKGEKMLEILVFFGSIGLVLSIGYTIKLFTAKKDHLPDIDCGRILDKDGKPTRQTTYVIDL